MLVVLSFLYVMLFLVYPLDVVVTLWLGSVYFTLSTLLRTGAPHLVISSLLIPVRPKSLAFPSLRPLTLR